MSDYSPCCWVSHLGLSLVQAPLHEVAVTGGVQVAEKGPAALQPCVTRDSNSRYHPGCFV